MHDLKWTVDSISVRRVIAFNVSGVPDIMLPFLKMTIRPERLEVTYVNDKFWHAEASGRRVIRTGMGKSWHSTGWRDLAETPPWVRFLVWEAATLAGRATEVK